MYWPNLIKFFFLLSALLVFSVTTTRVSELSESHQQLVNDLLQIYQCKANPSHFSHYAVDAEFRDPYVITSGRNAIQTLFEARTAILSDCQATLESVRSPKKNRLDVNLTVKYHLPLIGASTAPLSLELILNHSDKIIHQEDIMNNERFSASRHSSRAALQEVSALINQLDGSGIPRNYLILMGF
ncbi:MAG: hypothetical protein DHS80DRAFT_29260 [Piptocephalis tieghemiana]|nr:MAG: hypothetical protein DHS80DRAFT_29260 [Piptocephalis tieghemiana]